MGYAVAQDNATEPLVFLLVLSSDHITGATGKTPTVTLSKNGAAFASPAGAVSEIGNGLYKVAPAAADADTLGPLFLHASATACDPCDEQYDVVAYVPTAQPTAAVPAIGPTARNARTIITRAFKLIGVVAAGETPTSDEMSDGLDSLNAMVDHWASKGLTIARTSRSVWPLVSGTESYSIGAGATYDRDRPVSIRRAGYVIGTGEDAVERPLRMLAWDEYATYATKALTGGIPAGLYYEPTLPNGTIHLQPIPSDATDTLALYLPEPLTSFADLTTLYDIEPGALDALVSQLALRLAPEYGRPIAPAVAAMAIEAFADLQFQHYTPIRLQMDPALGGDYVPDVDFGGS